MRKYKQLIIGIIIGALLFNVIPSFATTVKQYIVYESPYPMYVNGKEFKSDLPILNYNGTTYIPLRATANILGVPVDFDGVTIKVGVENNNLQANNKGNTNKDTSISINTNEWISFRDFFMQLDKNEKDYWNDIYLTQIQPILYAQQNRIPNGYSFIINTKYGQIKCQYYNYRTYLNIEDLKNIK